MSVDSTGAAGQPLFDENQPSNLATDLNAISNFAARGDTYVECYTDQPVTLQPNTWKSIPFIFKIFDRYHFTDNGLEFTAPWTGRYVCEAKIGIGNNPMPAGTRLLGQFYRIGDGAATGSVLGVTAPVPDTDFLYRREITLTAGDQCRFQAFQNSNSALNLSNDPQAHPHILIRYLGTV